MRRSLRRRLFQAIGLIVALSVAITLGLGLVLTRRAVQEATLQDVAHQAALIAGEERNSIFPGAHLPQLSQYLAEQHELYRRNAALLPPAAQAKLAQRQAASGSVTIAGIGYYFAAEPLTTGPPLILLRPRSLTKSSWSPFVESILIAALVGGVLAAAAAYLLARRIVRPVTRVAAAARSLARGTRPEPVPVEGSAELATLALAFNDLSEQLARAREAERSFLLSVSHELKTPLTSIRGWAEALREGAVTPEDAAATTAVEAARLERLVGDLLDLARLNRTDFAITTSDIDLAEVADDTVRRYAQAAEAFGVALVAVAEGPAPAVADAERVLQGVSNLVENALRRTPPGGEVRVVAAPGAVRVEDTGPGLEDDDRARAFERFYLHARYGRARPVGTRLGGAIVKELTQAMGGTVEVESSPGEWTVFTVRLPVPLAQPVRA